MKERIKFIGRHQRIFLFIILVVGFFVVMLDSTVVNVALVSIGKDIQASDSGLQWIINSYNLSLASTLLVWGALCDRIGAHRVYSAGLVIFALASMACALADKTVTLLIARIFQGLGGACLIPASLALISKVATNFKERAQFIGWWGASGGLAAAAGPLLGGLLTSQFSWRAIFYLNPFLIVMVLSCLCMGRTSIKQRVEIKEHRFDWLGSVFMTLIMIAFSYAAIQGSTQYTLEGVLSIISGVVMVVLLVMHEQRSLQPLLPLSLLRQARFITANMVGFCLNFSFFGELFVLSLYLQRHLGLSIAYAGWALFPQTCSAIIAAPLGGKYAGRWGNLRVIQIGLCVGGIGFALLNLIDWNIPFILIAAFSFLASFGMAFAMPAATNQAVSCASDAEQGVAAGVINMTRQFGSVMGVSVIGSLFALGNIHAALLAAALMFLFPLIAISVWENTTNK